MKNQLKTIDIEGVLYDVKISRNRSHDLKTRLAKRHDYGFRNKWGELMIRIEPDNHLKIGGMVLKGFMFHSNEPRFEGSDNVYHKIYNYIQDRDFNLQNL